MSRIGDFRPFNKRWQRLTCGILQSVSFKNSYVDHENNRLVCRITVKKNDKRETFLLKHKWIFYLVNRFWYYWYVLLAVSFALHETFSPSIYIREGKRLKYLTKFIALLEIEGIIEYKEGR